MNTVISGDYKNASVGADIMGEVFILFGFKKIPLNCGTVLRYEVVSEQERTSATSAVKKAAVGTLLLGGIGIAAALGAKKKGTHLVAVYFADGKESLLQLNDKVYQAFLRAQFNHSPQPHTPSLEDKNQEPKKKKKTGLVVFFFIVAAIIGIIIGVNNSDSEPNEDKQENTAYLNVNQFAGISENELVDLFGEPKSKGELTTLCLFNIPCTYYDYDNLEKLGETSFYFVNNKLVKFTAYSTFPYNSKSKNANLENFGIEVGDNCSKTADTNYALRYSFPSETVEDFWMSGISNDQFDCLTVTFEDKYYEEWYLPTNITEESNYEYITKENVKSLLLSPSSSTFPIITNWTFGKNDYYYAVASSVTAPNGFGVNLTKEFLYIYAKDTNTVIYAIFDGEIVLNNGYVKTEKLMRDALGLVDPET